MKATLTITEDELKDIIRDHVSKNGFECTSKIKVNVVLETVGYGTSETEVPVFRDITVDIETKPLGNK
jgi:hypothetical protein